MQSFSSLETRQALEFSLLLELYEGDPGVAQPRKEKAKPGAKPVVFVTGASGLVGFHLVKLLGDQGHRVVAMVRTSSNSAPLFDYLAAGNADITVVTSDLAEQPRLVSYMRGCDVVVHTAACIDPHGDPNSLQTINVEGTRSVLKAAIAAGVNQFIHISSLSVIMGEVDCYGITEKEPLRQCREAYANSKVAAERLVMDPRVTKLIHVTALRPGFIYGPNEKTWLPKLIYNMRAGTAMLVGDGTKETNLIYVENLCRAIALTINKPVAFGQVYNLTDGELVTKRQLFDVICDQLEIPHVKLAISMPMARMLVNMSTAIARIAPPKLKGRLALFSRPALRLVGLNQGFDISKAERDLGYTDRIPFAEGMSKTLRSYSTATKSGATATPEMAAVK